MRMYTRKCLLTLIVPSSTDLRLHWHYTYTYVRVYVLIAPQLQGRFSLYSQYNQFNLQNYDVTHMFAKFNNNKPAVGVLFSVVIIASDKYLVNKQHSINKFCWICSHQNLINPVYIHQSILLCWTVIVVRTPFLPRMRRGCPYVVDGCSMTSYLPRALVICTNNWCAYNQATLI